MYNFLKNRNIKIEFLQDLYKFEYCSDIILACTLNSGLSNNIETNDEKSLNMIRQPSKTNSSYLIEKYMEIYGEKHQTKRLIMDLTEEDVDISSQGTQNQTMDKYASPERREVSIVEKRSPVLITNRGINRVL